MQDATSAWLFHSVATYISSNMKSTLYFSQFLELTVIYISIISGKHDTRVHEESKFKNKR